ncbi:fibroblast growth factor 22-like [Scleropages formosus]|uniref:Fibroblast growth factor n=1 Tax=Scleropages formosus TaxID=113540 RepID=A0A8C9RLG7_SCLFO|nr:fibroblast growth factor 22-like [Scleropages formosus]
MCKWAPPSAGLRPGLPSQSLHQACLLLVLAASATLAGFPAPGSEDEAQKALLQAPAETAHLSWDLGRRARSYNHLEGDVRLRRLYSANKFFLSIDSMGRVRGNRHGNQTDSLLEIRSVSMGVVVIRSVSTGLYLAMSKKGALYGSAKYTADCQFRERIEENGYNTYAALRWRRGDRPMFVSLGGRGRPRGGHRTRRKHRSAHFLPMLPT